MAHNLRRAATAAMGPSAFHGESNVDGNDDVWTTNAWVYGIVCMAGDNPKGHPPGTKAGDVLHLFTSGAFEVFTDVLAI